MTDKYWDKVWTLVDSMGNIHPDHLCAPLKTRKPTVFIIKDDLFHEDVPDEFRDDVYAMMHGCDRHTYLIVTKRADNMLRYFETHFLPIIAVPHIWHILTVCNQQEADAKIPIFLKVPGKKFLSIEPMLSHIETPFFRYHLDEYGNWREGGHINAVILGGETGPGARPIELDWIRSVRDQCKSAGVSFFLKHIDKKHGRLLDGKKHNDLPWRLR